MPIAPHLRHLYRGPEYEARRQRILERDRHTCQHCGKPAGAPRWVYHRRPRELTPQLTLLISRVQLGVAHLDHNPENNAEENLASLCQRCHFHHDQGQHKDTRSARKDRARPLLAGVDVEGVPNGLM